MSQDALMDNIISKKNMSNNWLLGYGKGFYRSQVACFSIHQGVTILNTRFQQKTLLLFFGFCLPILIIFLTPFLQNLKHADGFSVVSGAT